MLIPSEARFRRLFPLLAQHRIPVLVGACCTVIYVGTLPLIAQMAGPLSSAIGGRRFQEALATVVVVLAIFLAQKLAQYGQDALLAGPSLQVSQALRQDVFARLQRLAFPALEKLSSGDLAYRLTEDADRVGEVIYKTIHDSTPSALQLVTVLGYMSWLDGPLTAATLMLAPVMIGLVGWFGRQVLRASEHSQVQVSKLAALLAEAISGLHLVRAFASETWLQQRFTHQIDGHCRARSHTLELVALQHPIVGFLEATGILAILLLGAWRIHTGSLTTEQFISYLVALGMLIDPISHLTTNFNEFQQGQASLRRLRALEQEPLEPPDPPQPLTLGKVRGELRLENVHFSHTRTQPLFRDLTLHVRPGQLVALVGASGAGKSTLFSLLLRFNLPQQGRILLDGKNLCHVRAAELRRQMALVPQDALLFSGTVAETIDFGRGYDLAAIRRAAQLANAEAFILAMGGYDARVEERATNLSGGQRQRLAIARAVVGDPAVLLLDEATSALDAETEAAVQQGLRRAMAGRTVLVIAHRLVTVQGADQILVLEHGVIVEQGSHQQLLSRAGRYEDLCRQQLIHATPAAPGQGDEGDKVATQL
ncbi:ABC transporter ATP-binding protein [Candidatus Synechococcus spongiarum]|uniref:ABC transporter, possibly multidrug efflux n=1 Tax=Candidatus Synechococcus spongiarum TaxID=431041 RepID=A0A164Y2E5_9SYNE|nr:ABC transporter ATP-binding protein [Candidatus Synechococcus spongiarum]SAY38600.1 ABC transporter, possibly multidrug efflux [Candidatus Synechococcus spongiarum]